MSDPGRDAWPNPLDAPKRQSNQPNRRPVWLPALRSLDLSVPDRLAAPVASDTKCPEQPSIRAEREANRIRHLVLCAPRKDGLLVSGAI